LGILTAVSTSVQSTASGLDTLEPTTCPLVAGRARIIIRTAVDPLSMASARASVSKAGGSVVKNLDIIHGFAALIPPMAARGLAESPAVVHVSCDRVSVGAMERTGATVGATAVRSQFGYDGTGIGV